MSTCGVNMSFRRAQSPSLCRNLCALVYLGLFAQKMNAKGGLSIGLATGKGNRLRPSPLFSHADSNNKKQVTAICQHVFYSSSEGNHLRCTCFTGHGGDGHYRLSQMQMSSGRYGHPCPLVQVPENPEETKHEKNAA